MFVKHSLPIRPRACRSAIVEIFAVAFVSSLSRVLIAVGANKFAVGILYRAGLHRTVAAVANRLAWCVRFGRGSHHATTISGRAVVDRADRIAASEFAISYR